MIIKIGLFLLLIFTTSTLSNDTIKNSISSKQSQSIINQTKVIDKKPKRIFSLSDNTTDQNKVNKSKKDKNFIPTESISEDLSVPFPVDI
jgi:hypothetical protein